MKLFTIAIILTAVLLIAGGSLAYRRGIKWSSASSAATAVTSATAVGTGGRSAVIVELFTSEGCSSCPPADQVLAQLENTQPIAEAEIIALSEHVDYWNYIGWTDPFSSAAFSARQQAYADAFGNRDIYTPQMVVDGQAEFIGSHADKARAAISRTAQLPKAQVRLELAANEQTRDVLAIGLTIRVEKLPPVTEGDVAEVLLAITESNLASQVARGENAGRKLGHTAVVRELRSLGPIANVNKPFSAETTALLHKEWKRSELRAVAFVQEHDHKRMLGAAALKLSAQ